MALIIFFCFHPPYPCRMDPISLKSTQSQMLPASPNVIGVPVVSHCGAPKAAARTEIIVLTSEEDIPSTPTPTKEPAQKADLSSRKHGLDSISDLEVPMVLMPQDLIPSKKKKRINPSLVDPQVPIAAAHPAFSSIPTPKSVQNRFRLQAKAFWLTFPKCSASPAQVRDVPIVT